MHRAAIGEVRLAVPSSQVTDGITSHALSAKMPDWLSTPMARRSASKPYATPSLDADPGRMRIGDGSNGGHQCEGLLDEVALFNVPLEQDDIKEVMEDGLEGATGLLAVEPEDKLTTIWGGNSKQVYNAVISYQLTVIS